MHMRDNNAMVAIIRCKCQNANLSAPVCVSTCKGLDNSCLSFAPSQLGADRCTFVTSHIRRQKKLDRNVLWCVCLQGEISCVCKTGSQGCEINLKAGGFINTAGVDQQPNIWSYFLREHAHERSRKLHNMSKR